jgi:hypothetical protein
VVVEGPGELPELGVVDASVAVQIEHGEHGCHAVSRRHRGLCAANGPVSREIERKQSSTVGVHAVDERGKVLRAQEAIMVKVRKLVEERVQSRF